MNNKLYVSNLSFSIKDEDLEKVFTEVGEVISAKVIIDRFSGKSKGFGFVEMGSDEVAQKAIEQLHGKSFAGREIRVMVSQPKEPGAKPHYKDHAK